MSRIEEALNKAMGHQARPFAQSRTAAPAPPPPIPEAVSPEAARGADQMLLTLTAPQSPGAEEYRKLKEVLLKEAAHADFHNVIVVTSANPNEGKTVTVLNLAISLAQEHDYTVLVVDADLRSPSCHRLLGLENGPGLTECLKEEIDCEKALVRTNIGRLVLLPGGKPVANPVELISSSRMRQLIQELKHRYPDRFILIDSPPVNLFAESRFLTSMADGAIVVVREGETSMDDLSEALQAVDNKVLGIVYNDAKELPFSKPSHYYYYYAQPEPAGQ